MISRYRETLLRIMAKAISLSLSCLLVFSSQGNTESFSGKLVKVIDGDTVEVIHNGRAERIRLAHIDAPEKDQAFGPASKHYLLGIAALRQVRVEVKDFDRYGRTVGEIFASDGANLNKQIVGTGHAWHYKLYSRNSDYAELEERAKSTKQGLWLNSNPTPPWVWRHKRDATTKTKASDKTFFGCGEKRYCTQMTNCEEAKFYLDKCGLSRLDGDKDGVPCETVCL